MSEPTLPVSSTQEYYRPVDVYVVRPARPRYWLHLLLLAITFFTTLVVGARMQYNFLRNQPTLSTADDSPAIFPVIWATRESHLWLGLPFSLTLMTILLAHEMGHYLYCRRYQVAATLPFFIPFPTLIGTLGAFIRIRSPIRARSELFDIGIAGPIAGFVVAVAVLISGIGLSKPIHSGSSASYELGLPLIFHLVYFLRYGSGAPPLDTLLLHPVAVAAWVGMFATSLNLLPGGQLDGGHIVFSFSPRSHRLVSRLTALALIPMGYFFWVGWFVWAILLSITGMRHPIVPEWPGIDGSRRWLALFALLMLILTVSPAPIRHASLPEVVQQVRGN